MDRAAQEAVTTDKSSFFERPHFSLNSENLPFARTLFARPAPIPLEEQGSSTGETQWKLAPTLFMVWSDSGSAPRPSDGLTENWVTTAEGHAPPVTCRPAGLRNEHQTRKDEVMNKFTLTLLRVLAAWTT